MSNYEYIIASLPFLTADFKYTDQAGFNSVLAEIKRDMDDRDYETVEFLLDGFKEEELDADFYAKALRHRNRFIRDYFRFDLNLRNAKVRYLNAQLGRPAEMDVLTGEDPDSPDSDIDGFRFTGGEFEEEAKIQAVLESSDLLAREKGIDDLVWDKVDRLATFHYFDLEAVLAYVVKLSIVNRWLALDEEIGRERFHRLIGEVRGTFKGVKYTEQ